MYTFYKPSYFQDEVEKEEFETAYNCYLRSLASEQQNVPIIEIDDEDNDGECEFVEHIVAFQYISDNDDDSNDVILISPEEVSFINIKLLYKIFNV